MGTLYIFMLTSCAIYVLNVIRVAFSLFRIAYMVKMLHNPDITRINIRIMSNYNLKVVHIGFLLKRKYSIK